MKSYSLKFLILLLFLPFFFTKGNARDFIAFESFVSDSSDIKDTCVYAYITSIKKDTKEVLLFVDFIQYYSGDEAIMKAKERGDADTLYKSGKMIISVPGDYYIVNDSKKIRKFYLSKKVKLNLQLNQDRLHPISDNSLNSFIKIYRDSPFLLYISDNEIIKIDEILLP